MHSGDKTDEYFSFDRFDSIEPNFLQKRHKIIKNSKRSVTGRHDKIELIRLILFRYDSIRFEIRLNFDSFTLNNFNCIILYWYKQKMFYLVSQINLLTSKKCNFHELLNNSALFYSKFNSLFKIKKNLKRRNSI